MPGAGGACRDDEKRHTDRDKEQRQERNRLAPVRPGVPRPALSRRVGTPVAQAASADESRPELFAEARSSSGVHTDNPQAEVPGRKACRLSRPTATSHRTEQDHPGEHRLDEKQKCRGEENGDGVKCSGAAFFRSALPRGLQRLKTPGTVRREARRTGRSQLLCRATRIMALSRAMAFSFSAWS